MQEMQETWVLSLGQEDLLEEEMAPHSCILAGKIPRTEEPGGLQSMGLQSRTLISIINAGEGVEKREPSHTVDGNAN